MIDHGITTDDMGARDTATPLTRLLQTRFEHAVPAGTCERCCYMGPCTGACFHAPPAVAAHDAEEDRITLISSGDEPLNPTQVALVEWASVRRLAAYEPGLGKASGGPSEACVVPGCAECGS